MKRSAKISYNYAQALADLQRTGIVGEVINPVCHLVDNSEVSLGRCLGFCSTPCFHFLNFEFITNLCSVDGCSSSVPCHNCFDSIETHKMLMKLFLAENRPSVFSYKTGHKSPPSRRPPLKVVRLMKRRSK